MSTRISSALVLPLLLAACGEGAPGLSEADGEVLDCALDGAAKFAPDCRISETSIEGESVSVIRHPDGGFRRLDELRQPRDGAIAAQSRVEGAYVVVQIGDDRYRWDRVPEND